MLRNIYKHSEFSLEKIYGNTNLKKYQQLEPPPFRNAMLAVYTKIYIVLCTHVFEHVDISIWQVMIEHS